MRLHPHGITTAALHLNRLIKILRGSPCVCEREFHLPSVRAAVRVLASTCACHSFRSFVVVLTFFLFLFFLWGSPTQAHLSVNAGVATHHEHQLLRPRH